MSIDFDIILNYFSTNVHTITKSKSYVFGQNRFNFNTKSYLLTLILEYNLIYYDININIYFKAIDFSFAFQKSRL